ncbi:HD domain-containing protein [Patescibacteria group bacterium]|nr:HD domain-containing protein [Patescibacteria group bacterium]
MAQKIFDFSDTKKLFQDFTDREKLLKRVTRYDMYKPMFYRSNLFTHSQHVAWIIHDLAPNLQQAFGDSINIAKAIIMALVHDDLEIIMGDVMSSHKENMNPEQTKELHQTEKKAIQEISKKFPEKVGPYNYIKLQLEANDLTTLEAQVFKYADWTDALAEALHEVYAGNTAFAINVSDKYGKNSTAFEYYIPRLTDFAQTYPKTAALFQTESPFLEKPKMLNFLEIAKNNSPHTINSIINSVNYPLYDHWKQIIKQYAAPEIAKLLYKQIEFK